MYQLNYITHKSVYKIEHSVSIYKAIQDSIMARAFDSTSGGQAFDSS